MPAPFLLDQVDILQVDFSRDVNLQDVNLKLKNGKTRRIFLNFWVFPSGDDISVVKNTINRRGAEAQGAFLCVSASLRLIFQNSGSKLIT